MQQKSSESTPQLVGRIRVETDERGEAPAERRNAKSRRRRRTRARSSSLSLRMTETRRRPNHLSQRRRASRPTGTMVRLSLFPSLAHLLTGLSLAAEPPSKKPKLGKNPTVDTHFLPDREREEAERKERDELRKKWLKMQEDMKQEPIEITYSYWDGSGHRKVVSVRRGTWLLSCWSCAARKRD